MTLTEAVNIFFENSLLVVGFLFGFGYQDIIEKQKRQCRKLEIFRQKRFRQKLMVLPENCLQIWTTNNAETKSNDKIQKGLQTNEKAGEKRG